MHVRVCLWVFVYVCVLHSCIISHIFIFPQNEFNFGCVQCGVEAALPFALINNVSHCYHHCHTCKLLQVYWLTKYTRTRWHSITLLHSHYYPTFTYTNVRRKMWQFCGCLCTLSASTYIWPCQHLFYKLNCYACIFLCKYSYIMLRGQIKVKSVTVNPIQSHFFIQCTCTQVQLDDKLLLVHQFHQHQLKSWAA